MENTEQQKHRQETARKQINTIPIPHFKTYGKQDLLSLTHIRKFETKLGERIRVAENAQDLEQSIKDTEAEYVILGIPEDLGIKANGHTGGADTAWIPFLQAFLNIQSNDFLEGSNLMLLGNFDFGDIQYLIENNALGDTEKLEAYRHAVTVVDEEVEWLVKMITSCQKIPIVIGGGHNNAYPLSKARPKAFTKQAFSNWHRSMQSTWMRILITALWKGGTAEMPSVMRKRMDTFRNTALSASMKTIFPRISGWTL
jgi:formiminoglutamase